MIIVVEELRAMFAVTPRDLSMSVSTHAFMDIRFMSIHVPFTKTRNNFRICWDSRRRIYNLSLTFRDVKICGVGAKLVLKFRDVHERRRASFREKDQGDDDDGDDSLNCTKIQFLSSDTYPSSSMCCDQHPLHKLSTNHIRNEKVNLS